MSSIYRVNYQLRPHRRDTFIEFIKALMINPFILYQHSDGDCKHLRQGYADVMQKLEAMIIDHIKHPQQSRLSQLVPTITTFFTPLPLQEAFLVYDAHTKLAARKYIPPAFNDIRHLLNIAQIIAISKQLKLMTFDGDQTLYGDGMDFANDDVLVTYIVQLLKRGLFIAVVTAAGYPNAPERYEQRLSGLLNGFRKSDLSELELSHFYVLGGECNFLFQCTKEARLKGCKDEDFFTPEMRSWDPEALSQLLDTAESTFRERVSSLELENKTIVLRKQRAVGIISKEANPDLPREILDEIVMAADYNIRRSNNEVPFCAFNGGRDAWVDVGNKLLGVQALQSFLKIASSETLHVGDQFLSLGNDIATRSACCTLWVTNPTETRNALETMLEEMIKESPK